jgi:hypothetical protein
LRCVANNLEHLIKHIIINGFRITHGLECPHSFVYAIFRISVDQFKYRLSTVSIAIIYESEERLALIVGKRGASKLIFIEQARVGLQGLE